MRNEYLQDTKKKIAAYSKWCTQLELRKKDLEIMIENDGIEDEILKFRNTKAKIYLELEIRRLEYDIEKVNKGLRTLDELEYQIVELKYRKKNSWVSVSMETGYSMSRCKELGKIAIMQVGEAIHGVIIHQDLPLVAGVGCY